MNFSDEKRVVRKLRQVPPRVLIDRNSHSIALPLPFPHILTLNSSSSSHDNEMQKAQISYQSGSHRSRGLVIKLSYAATVAWKNRGHLSSEEGGYSGPDCGREGDWTRSVGWTTGRRNKRELRSGTRSIGAKECLIEKTM